MTESNWNTLNAEEKIEFLHNCLESLTATLNFNVNKMNLEIPKLRAEVDMLTSQKLDKVQKEQ